MSIIIPAKDAESDEYKDEDVNECGMSATINNIRGIKKARRVTCVFFSFQITDEALTEPVAVAINKVETMKLATLKKQFLFLKNK